MTTRLSRERALTSALDHLHTPASELARFASKVAVDAAPASSVPTPQLETASASTVMDSTLSGPTGSGPTGSGPTVSGPTVSGPTVSGPTVSGSTLTGARALRLRTARPPRWRLAAALGAILLTGFSGATLAGSSPADTTPRANSVLAYGAARSLGSGANLQLRAGVVAIASDPVGPGYWLAGSDGGVFAFGDSSYYGSTGATTLNAPMVGIAPTPHGRGYWLVGADGGVFAFGDAAYHGSMAGEALAAPIVSIVPTRSGHGYWLVATDGGVFAFGDARFYGSAQDMDLARPIVGAAATRTGRGYWLLGSDGGVFSFGDARFAGAVPDPTKADAVGIASSRQGRGYWIARADGSVEGFHVFPRANSAVFIENQGLAKTVAIAASSTGGYWIAQGEQEKVAPSLASDPFLACTRAHESDSSGGYQAVSAGGAYRGAYQFDRSTWDSAARLSNRPDLVGVDPAAAAPGDQDLLALNLFHARGSQPWGGRCAGLT
jgi:hypothetical protein